MRQAPIPPRVHRTPNPETVAVLKRALELLWDGKSGSSPGWAEFTCHCVSATHTEALGGSLFPVENHPVQALMEASLDAWAKVGHFPLYVQSLKKATGIADWTLEEIQDGRRRWLIQLVEELSLIPI